MTRFNLLRVEGLRAGYGGGADVLHGVDLDVDEHEIVTILGSNGAGKTTLLMTIAGLLRPRAGRISLRGEDITGLPAHALVSRGLAMVPSGRQVFPDQTVEENLLLGGHHYRRDRRRLARMLHVILERFPALAERRGRPAGLLSGGEQQLLSIGRGLMARPRLMLFDEPSMGLAPVAVRQIFDLVRELHEEGTTLLIVEKLAHLAISLSDRIWVLELGSVVVSGDAHVLAGDPRVEEAYLGRAAGGR